MNTIGLNEHSAAALRPKKAPFVAKGHDRQLEEAQFGKFRAEIITQSGIACVGKVVRRDKFTITIHDGSAEGELMLYKHAIESVRIDRNTVLG